MKLDANAKRRIKREEAYAAGKCMVCCRLKHRKGRTTCRKCGKVNVATAKTAKSRAAAL